MAGTVEMRYLLFLVLLLCVNAALAQQEKVIAAQVIAGHGGYELPINVTNRNKEAIKNLEVSVVEVPQGITNLTIEAYKIQASENSGPYGLGGTAIADSPKGIESLAPGETGYYTVRFDVSLDAKAAENALLKFKVRAGDADFDDPDPSLLLKIVNPVPSEVYYKLVSIETRSRLEDEITSSSVTRRRFDAGTASFAWTKDTTQSRYKFVETQSMGFHEYPEKIILGQPFSFNASVITQRDIFPGWCQSAEEQALNFHAGITIKSATRTSIKSVPYRISDCRGSRSNQTVHAGGMITLSIHCEPVGRKAFSGTFSYGTLRHKYDCRAIALGEDKSSGHDNWELDLDLLYKIDTYQNPALNKNGQYAFEVPDHIGRAANLDVYLSTSHERNQPVRLVYQPMSGDGKMLQNTGTVNHPIAVNNSVEGQESAETDVAGEVPGRENETANPGSTETAAREKDRRRVHIEHWLANAIPVENAQPGYNLSYDPWGRVHGKAPNGVITLAKPDSGGLSPADYAWIRADRLDSLNLCTLEDYVERKLANRETASCQKNIPSPPTQIVNANIIPDFVGQEAVKAKIDLEKLGLKVKWRAGSIAKDARQQSLVEKQSPSAGSALDNIKEVELWVYRYATKSISVPNVIGLSFEEAAAKLQSVGLQAAKGEERSVLTLASVGKVMGQTPKARSAAQIGSTVSLAIGARGSMPDNFRLGSLNRRTDQTQGTNIPNDTAANQNWAGLWRVDGRYNMELTVSGNRVSGRYGENMEKTVEGTISDNTLTGRWQEVQTGRFNRTLYGRFQNTISADGNSWSGHWNMMKETVGGWNGGWRAVRIGEKKPPLASGQNNPISGSRNRGTSSSGPFCAWDGGTQIFGVPGYEISVYCKCDGKRVEDSRCPGPKPKPNYN